MASNNIEEVLPLNNQHEIRVEFSNNLANSATTPSVQIYTQVSDFKTRYHKKFIDNYPTNTIAYLSFAILIANFIVILVEFSYDLSGLGKNNEFKYVAKNIMASALVNISFAILALISSN